MRTILRLDLKTGTTRRSGQTGSPQRSFHYQLSRYNRQLKGFPLPCLSLLILALYKRPDFQEAALFACSLRILLVINNFCDICISFRSEKLGFSKLWTGFCCRKHLTACDGLLLFEVGFPIHFRYLKLPYFISGFYIGTYRR